MGNNSRLMAEAVQQQQQEASMNSNSGTNGQQFVTLATTAYKFKRFGECIFAISQLQVSKNSKVTQ